MLTPLALATSAIMYTDGSTAPGNPGPSAYGFFGIDNLNYIYNGYGPVGILNTNNAAELTAILRCVQYVLSKPELLLLTIKSDSKYAIDGIAYLPRWERNNWLTSLGTAVANIGLWQDIQRVLKTYAEVGGKIKFEWVRGHSGIAGNEAADQNANKGRIALIQNDLTNVCEITTPDEFIQETLGAGVKIKPKKRTAVKPMIPLLSGNRWFFNTNQTNTLLDGRAFYTASTYKDTVKLNMRVI